ncbi:MAG: aminotransferase class IV family protein [Candidatus Aenigmarchaeota archaeon]|nr:aminotransferase class IV family protein [Candidatus Aenigmarchaeota archaeon]
MEAGFAIKNGELIRKEDANISVYNKSFFFDFVVYSNIKVVNGNMFIPELEIEKLFQSAKKIGIKHGFSKKIILEWMRILIKKNNIENALVRLLLIGPDMDTETILFLFPVGLTFYPKKFYSKGVKVITFQGERLFPTAKTKSLLLNFIAYREASGKGAVDALLIDRNGNIAEGTRTSFFAVKGDTLIAPPDDNVLEGVTRKIILEIAPQIMKIKKQKISLKEIKNYDFLILSGTTLGIMPISHVDNKRLEIRNPEKLKHLQKIFREYCDKEYKNL